LTIGGNAARYGPTGNQSFHFLNARLPNDKSFVTEKKSSIQALPSLPVLSQQSRMAISPSDHPMFIHQLDYRSDPVGRTLAGLSWVMVVMGAAAMSGALYLATRKNNFISMNSIDKEAQ
jgi:hypothetical protein